MLILLPPSEGKRHGGDAPCESLSYPYPQPLTIASSATESKLKCTGTRYAEGIALNQSIDQGPWMAAIDRYDGVMYRAINYPGLSDEGRAYFDHHVRILSGMYGLLTPHDQIANYKLPVSTRLKHYRKQPLTDLLNQIEVDHIIDLLPGAYRQMIDRKQLHASVTTIERRQSDGHKVSHGVKGLKGRWLHELCERQGTGLDLEQDVITVSV